MPPSKTAKPKKPTSSATSTTTPAPPNWPPLRPLPFSNTLSLQTLLPSQILTIPHFFPASLCKTYVSFLSTLPLTTTPNTPKKGDAVRVNDRFQIHDAGFAEKLWSETGLRGLVLGIGEERGGEGGLEEGEGLYGLDDEGRRGIWGGDVIGLNPNIRIYRYTPGQHFAPHYDDSNTLSFPSASSSLNSPPIPARTTWTLLLYLTSCVGGETVFYPSTEDSGNKKGKKKAGGKEIAAEPVVCEPEVGMALLHRHGRECLLHEGREVREGVKWVIRSDLCVRR